MHLVVLDSIGVVGWPAKIRFSASSRITIWLPNPRMSTAIATLTYRRVRAKLERHRGSTLLTRTSDLRRGWSRWLPTICCLLAACLISCTTESVQEAEPGGAAESTHGSLETPRVETVDGVTVVHNAGSLWGETPSVSLEPVRVLGCEDGELAFYEPADIAIGPAGYLYVLDAGNHRILRIDSQGSVAASFGKRGEGPGELQRANGLAIDAAGRMYVSDAVARSVKVLAPDGEELRTIATGTTAGRLALLSSGELVVPGIELFRGPEIDAIISVYNPDGELVRGVGELFLYEDWDAYRLFNQVSTAIGGGDELFVAYAARNKIEKYDVSGELVMRFDRPLDYEISQEVEQVLRQVGPRTIELPMANHVSVSVALDAAGRIWVLSYDRQLRFDEMALTIAFADADGNLEGTEELKVADRTETDAFSFHVFDREGRFLGRVPIGHHGGPVEISGNSLYILEPRHDMCVYEYRIVDDGTLPQR